MEVDLPPEPDRHLAHLHVLGHAGGFGFKLNENLLVIVKISQFQEDPVE